MFYERITSWAWILRTFLSIPLATAIMYRTLSCNHVVCDNLHAPLHLIHWRDFFAPLVSFAQDNGWSTLRSVSAFNAASVSFFDCVLTISPPQSSQGRELCNTQFTTFLPSVELYSTFPNTVVHTFRAYPRNCNREPKNKTRGRTKRWSVWQKRPTCHNFVPLPNN